MERLVALWHFSFLLIFLAYKFVMILFRSMVDNCSHKFSFIRIGYSLGEWSAVSFIHILNLQFFLCPVLFFSELDVISCPCFYISFSWLIPHLQLIGTSFLLISSCKRTLSIGGIWSLGHDHLYKIGIPCPVFLCTLQVHTGNFVLISEYEQSLDLYSPLCIFISLYLAYRLQITRTL